MGEDFSAPFRNVGYFGVWASESDAAGKRNALSVLCDAANQCHERDARTSNVLSALSWMARHGGQEKRAAAFRKALYITDPDMRRMAVRAAYKLMADAVATDP